MSIASTTRNRTSATMEPDIPAFLDRRPLVYTYTNLNAYRNVCPHQMFRRYIARDIPYVESPEMAWGTRVHEAFEKRVGSGVPLPDDMRQWECFAAPFDKYQSVKCEQKLGSTDKAKPTGFFDKNVWLRGKADLVVRDGNTVYMADWKTGNSKFEDPWELAIGAMLLKINDLTIEKVVGSYVWLKENRLGQQYDLSDFLGTWNSITAVVSLIEADRRNGEFVKNKSGLCGWCDVTDCENYYVSEKKAAKGAHAGIA